MENDEIVSENEDFSEEEETEDAEDLEEVEGDGCFNYGRDEIEWWGQGLGASAW